jgi:hypothetical protein
MAKRSQSDDLGVPPGLQLYSSFPFSGLNLSSSRPAIRDQDFWNIENWVRVGDGNLRTLWDVGPAIFTASGGNTIVNAFFYNIAITQYAVVFLSDGTGYQIQISNGATTPLSTIPNTFYDGGNLPGCIQWGSQYLLIGNNHNEDAYWSWDGSLLYTAGTVSPNIIITDGGSGYSTIPSVTIEGGEGTGATFVASIQNGSVVTVSVQNPGVAYQPIDSVQLVFTGGGSDNQAFLQANLTPSPVNAIVVTDGGNGYATAPAVMITDADGSGAMATATVSGGSVVSVTVTANGSGYVGAPTVSFSGGGGTGASAYASISPSGVASISVISGGSGYDFAPTLTIEGSGGVGATATANVSGGAITSVTMTDDGNGYINRPNVIIESAVNRAASATIELMPYDISGTTLEAFQSRVWIANPFTPPTNSPSQNNGNKFQVSAPGSISDFATSDGGLIFTATDRFLRQQYVAMRQSNGYLYPIGDSSCSIISGVSTSGNPPTTTFSYQNTDPQIGTPWRDSCQDFGRTIVFANQLGVYGLYGGSVTKISQNLDPLFSFAMFPPTPGALTPTSAVVNLYGGKYYCLLLTTLNQITLTPSNRMIVWDESEWFLANQSVNLQFICTQEVDSDLMAWGSDGNSLYPLFQTPNSDLIKSITTKLFGGNQPFIAKQVFTVMVQGINIENRGQPVTVSIYLDTEVNEYPVGPFPLTFSVMSNYQIAWPMAATGLTDAAGIFLGITMTTTQPDMALTYLALTYTASAFQVGSIGLEVPGQS